MSVKKSGSRARPKAVSTGKPKPARHRLRKWLAGIAFAFVILIIIGWVASLVSPWPKAMFIRYAFDRNNAKVTKALAKYVPAGITQLADQQYRSNDKDAHLDVFYPAHSTAQLPAIVWVHGGAWVAGTESDVDNYLQILASHGFAAVSVNYTLAPQAHYPTPIVQLNDALGFLQQQAQRFHIDPDRLVLAGDSAGSQIVAQMANMITSPAYARLVGIAPKTQAAQLKGMLLNCGAYDLALADYNGPFGGFLHTVLWAYSGKKDFLHDQSLAPASVANYLTGHFPPAFITAGNDDPLESQSKELAQRLGQLGVPTSTLFYPANHQPKLPHEYQFNLDTADGKHALQQMLMFLQRYDAP